METWFVKTVGLGESGRERGWVFRVAMNYKNHSPLTVLKTFASVIQTTSLAYKKNLLYSRN